MEGEGEGAEVGGVAVEGGAEVVEIAGVGAGADVGEGLIEGGNEGAVALATEAEAEAEAEAATVAGGVEEAAAFAGEGAGEAVGGVFRRGGPAAVLHRQDGREGHVRTAKAAVLGAAHRNSIDPHRTVEAHHRRGPAALPVAPPIGVTAPPQLGHMAMTGGQKVALGDRVMPVMGKEGAVTAAAVPDEAVASDEAAAPDEAAVQGEAQGLPLPTGVVMRGKQPSWLGMIASCVYSAAVIASRTKSEDASSKRQRID